VKPLFSTAIPGAGISIAGIFTLGATLSYGVGFAATIQGTATVNFGLSAGSPTAHNLSRISKTQAPAPQQASVVARLIRSLILKRCLHRLLWVHIRSQSWLLEYRCLRLVLQILILL